MTQTKDILLDAVRRKAEQEALHLAGEFVRAPAEEKADILAALHFEKWLAESCRECLY